MSSSARMAPGIKKDGGGSRCDYVPCVMDWLSVRLYHSDSVVFGRNYKREDTGITKNRITLFRQNPVEILDNGFRPSPFEYKSRHRPVTLSSQSSSSSTIYHEQLTGSPITVAARSKAWTVFARSDASRSQWPRGLRHELSSLARTLRSWFRIPLNAWKSVLCAFNLCLCFSVCR
jgi:hypothetical protein